MADPTLSAIVNRVTLAPKFARQYAKFTALPHLVSYVGMFLYCASTEL